MSLLSRRRDYGGPREPSAAERAIDMPAAGPHPCAACGDTSRVHRIDIGGGFGKQYVCVEPKPCRHRATQAGIWGRYPR